MKLPVTRIAAIPDEEREDHELLVQPEHLRARHEEREAVGKPTRHRSPPGRARNAAATAIATLRLRVFFG
jgi:hypothetical protein